MKQVCRYVENRERQKKSQCKEMENSAYILRKVLNQNWTKKNVKVFIDCPVPLSLSLALYVCGFIQLRATT